MTSTLETIRRTLRAGSIRGQISVARIGVETAHTFGEFRVMRMMGNRSIQHGPETRSVHLKQGAPMRRQIHTDFFRLFHRRAVPEILRGMF